MIQENDNKTEKDIQKLLNEIIKFFPMFFGDFSSWEYGNGTDATKDIKRIYNRALRVNKKFNKK